jgi:hypothetical protein
MIQPELFVFIDIVKGALLRRFEREFTQVFSDTFLSNDRRAQSAILYDCVGIDFVEFIKSLHTLKDSTLLFVAATKAVRVFQENLDKVWVFAYDGKGESITQLCGGSENEIVDVY